MLFTPTCDTLEGVKAFKRPLKTFLGKVVQALAFPLVSNVRRGFATNSSSSHSFVYMKKPHLQVGTVPRDEDGYGHQDFRLDTLMEKLFYVLVGRLSDLYEWDTPHEEKVKLAQEAFGHLVPEFTTEDFEEAVGSYVDHQSVDTIGWEEARDPFVVVFGGGDDGPSYNRRQARDEIDWFRTHRTHHDEED